MKHGELEVNLQVALEQGLNEGEFEKICDILGRKPNFTEIGVFALMWSEHCSYKSSRIHLKKFPTEGPYVLEGPGENAGAIDIGDGYAAVFKVESHNHPSFIEPYQGAATGVGGILRDVFTMGARPVASLNSLRFGDSDHPLTERLVRGVVAGIGGYGNCIGVPTVGGEVFFNPSYNGNILVNAFTLGICKHEEIHKAIAAGEGNSVIYVGSRTGRDGIHGAGLLASKAFNEGQEEMRPTVQVGDPFQEKKLLEACLEVMRSGLVVGIQDMGAAGLSSSSLEMAGRGDVGIEMHLDRVPTREDGMTPYELMLSESQERMLLVVESVNVEKVKMIFDKWDLNAVEIGQVTGDGRLRLGMRGEQVADLPVKELSDNAPLYDRPYRKPEWQADVQELDLDGIKQPDNYTEVLRQLISSPNLCSKRWVWEQYDSTIGTDTVYEPGSDAAVVRIKGTDRAIAISSDCNARYCYLDPRNGGKIAVAEAARNVACTGAKPLALTDCLNFGNPERQEIMWQFVEAVEGIAEAGRMLETPVVSGNVSFYNETDDEAIYPTPTVVMVGLIEDMAKTVPSSFSAEGDEIVLLGENLNELGGSEYLSYIHNLERGLPPVLDLDREKALHQLLKVLADDRSIRSAHDVSDGGLAVAILESLFNENHILGAEIKLSITDEIRKDALLFGESQSRVVLSVSPDKTDEVLAKACDFSIPAVRIGRIVSEPKLKISIDGTTCIEADVRLLHNDFSSGFKKIIREE